jgi:hypothetical protein
MADPIPSTVTVPGVAEPHQSTVATILRAAETGHFTAAQAEVMIDRVRAHLTAPPVEFPSFVADGLPATAGGHEPDALFTHALLRASSPDG